MAGNLMVALKKVSSELLPWNPPWQPFAPLVHCISITLFPIFILLSEPIPRLFPPAFLSRWPGLSFSGRAAKRFSVELLPKCHTQTHTHPLTQGNRKGQSCGLWGGSEAKARTQNETRWANNSEQMPNGISIWLWHGGVSSPGLCLGSEGAEDERQVDPAVPLALSFTLERSHQFHVAESCKVFSLPALHVGGHEDIPTENMVQSSKIVQQCGIRTAQCSSSFTVLVAIRRRFLQFKLYAVETQI